MPRPKAQQPTYYASRGAYYCWHDGKQHLCAVGPQGDKETLIRAFEAWEKIKEGSLKGEGGDDTRVSACLAIYLHYLETKKKPKTLRSRRAFSRSFLEYLNQHVTATVRVKDLTPILVDEWVKSHETPTPHKKHGDKVMNRWGSMTRYTAISTIKAGLNYCLKMGHIKTNPIARMELPKIRSRGKEVLISDKEHKQLMEYLGRHSRGKAFSEFLIALKDTGCRPGEIYSVTCDEVKEDNGVLYLDLSSFKTEAEHAFRHIFLSSRAETIVRRLMAEYPAGTLFRNANKKPLKEFSIMRNFQRLREELDLNPKLTAYSYRHTFATNWLKAGKSITLLAQLMGNSVRTIEHHYSHLLSDKSAMQKALRDFTD